MCEYNNTVMGSNLQSQILVFLESACNLSTNDLLVVGLSGGSDSLCLFDVLAESGWSMAAAHLDHGLRLNSSVDAQRVKELVENRMIPFHSVARDVHKYSEVNNLSIEEAAREVRYQFLFGLAESLAAKAVLVAHHAGDQVETVLMHLLRGSGSKGLRGMRSITYLPQYSENIPLVRPLLDVTRPQILAYCEEKKLQPIEDETNQDPTLFRNRIRLELIPELESYNPRIQEVILRSTKVLSGEDALLEEYVELIWPTVVAGSEAEWVRIRTHEFLSCSQPLRRQIARRAVFSLKPGLRDFSFENTQGLVDMIEYPPASGRAELIAGLFLVHESGSVWLTGSIDKLPVADWPQLRGGDPLHLGVPGSISMENGWEIHAEMIEFERSRYPIEDLPHQTGDKIYANADLINIPLVVRPRRAGDRFMPFGLDGHTQKLSDFMVNEKIPGRVRDRWPIVMSDQEILWVPGFRLSEKFRVTDQSKKIVKLSLLRN